MRTSPCLKALLALVLGGVFMAMLTIPEPLGQEDKDGDGISDIFQELEVRSDMVLSSTGEWKEVEIGYESTLDLTFTLFLGSVSLLIIPFAVYYISSDGPKKDKELGRKRASSAMHDNLRRISSFMSINPSIPNATRLSHVSQFGEGERILGQVLWTSRTSGTSVESSLKEVTRRWAGDDRVLISAIEGLVSAQGEGSKEEVLRSTESVVERMSKEIRERMETYSRSLNTPATALFGIGVLLPVLLATMIPIAGLSIKTVIMVGAVLWILIPLMIIRISTSLVLKRPLVNERVRDPSGSFDFKFPWLMIVVIGIVGASLSCVILLGMNDAPVLIEGPFPCPVSTMILVMMISVSMMISSLFSMISESNRRERMEIGSQREKVPDLLSEVGAQLMEGRSVERAISRGYERIGERPPLHGRMDLDRKMSHLRGYLQVASDFSRSGGRTGGRAVKALSRHLKEMAGLERSMKEMIRSSVGQMEITSSVFAPIMIGASVGIFRIMDSTSPLLQGGEMIGGTISRGDMTVPGFILLSGVYLLLLSISTSISLYRLEEGEIRGGLERVPRNVLLSSIMFTAGVVISTLVLGG